MDLHAIIQLIGLRRMSGFYLYFPDIHRKDRDLVPPGHQAIGGGHSRPHHPVDLRQEGVREDRDAHGFCCNSRLRPGSSIARDLKPTKGF